ncbi:MAG: hypothetical protein AMXMBFR22_30820 [Phycisphaerae bacterium]
MREDEIRSELGQGLDRGRRVRDAEHLMMPAGSAFQKGPRTALCVNYENSGHPDSRLTAAEGFWFRPSPAP